MADDGRVEYAGWDGEEISGLPGAIMTKTSTWKRSWTISLASMSAALMQETRKVSEMMWNFHDQTGIFRINAQGYCGNTV